MGRSSDAWFKFYVDDWLDATRDLNLEQRGAYIDAIALQYRDGKPLADDMQKLAHRLHVSKRKAVAIFDELCAATRLIRAERDGNRVIFDERAIKELEERERQRLLAAENGATGGRPKRDSKPVQPPLDDGSTPGQPRTNDEPNATEAPLDAEIEKSPNEINDPEKGTLSKPAETRAPLKKEDKKKEEEDREEKKPSLSGGSKSSPGGSPPAEDADAGKAKARRGTRLPNDWILPAEWHAWTVEAVDISVAEIARQAEMFRNFWIAKAGNGAAKLDWFATWKNWLDRDFKRRPGAISPVVPVAHAKPRKPAPSPFWWRGKEAEAKRYPDDVWEDGIRQHANGSWPVEFLGEPPGHPGCLVPPSVIKRHDLIERYGWKEPTNV